VRLGPFKILAYTGDKFLLNIDMHFFKEGGITGGGQVPPSMFDVLLEKRVKSSCQMWWILRTLFCGGRPGGERFWRPPTKMSLRR
jgi:hypothetical protein